MVHHPTPPIHETNPWAMGPTSQIMGSGDTTTTSELFPGRPPSTNPFVTSNAPTASPVTNGTVAPGVVANPAVSSVAFQHMRSHSIDTSDMSTWHTEPSKKQTLLAISQHQSFQQGSASPGNTWANNTDWTTNTSQQTSLQNQSASSNVVSNNTTGTVDPFDVAWMAKNSNKKETASSQLSKTTYKVDL